MKLIHVDLFSGLGGFALAAEQVWPTIEHVFCDNDTFCQSVIRKHWPNSKLYGDIKQVDWKQYEGAFLMSGGFPCQPYSAAGKRRGTADDRYLWPEMLRAIREARPKYVLGENVQGLISINDGMVFEQVLSDLENENYETGAFIIPASSINAPHQRYRVWIIGRRIDSDADSDGRLGRNQEIDPAEGRESAQRDAQGRHNETVDDPNAVGIGRGGRSESRTKVRKREMPEAEAKGHGGDAPHDPSEGLEGGAGKGVQGGGTRLADRSEWDRDWREVAYETCLQVEVEPGFRPIYDGLTEGLPGLLRNRRVGDKVISHSKWRQESLKAIGNGIVGQVAVELMKAIKEADETI
jgi:DNA (cytosine-5)-methyltransferase 1